MNSSLVVEWFWKMIKIGAAIYNGYGIIEDCGVQDAQCLGS